MQRLVKLGIFTSSQINIAERILGEYIDNAEYKPFLVHNDIRSSHIYQNNGTFTGIIDFGLIESSTFLGDLAHIKGREPQYFDSILNGFQQVRKLTSEELTHLDYECFLHWARRIYWKTMDRGLMKYELVMADQLKNIYKNLR